MLRQLLLHHASCGLLQASCKGLCWEAGEGWTHISALHNNGVFQFVSKGHLKEICPPTNQGGPLLQDCIPFVLRRRNGWF